VSYTSFRLIGRRSLNREASDIGTSFVSTSKHTASISPGAPDPQAGGTDAYGA